MSQPMLSDGQPFFFYEPPSTQNQDQGERREMMYRDPDQIYVGFWRRLLAYLIDAAILTLVNWLLPLSDLVQRILDILYFVIMPCSSWQGTVGKRVIGAKIVDGQGERISFLRSLCRYFAQILSALILLIGFIMIGFTREKRGLHDWICDTFVINRDSEFYP